MASGVYNYFKQGVMCGSFNLGGTPTVYLALVSNTYAPDYDTHKYRSSLTDVVTPSNYTAVFALSGPNVQMDTTGNQGILYGTNILIANVTFGTSVRAAVLFGSTANGSASDPLIAYVDFGADYTVTAGTFQIQWAVGGILALT